MASNGIQTALRFTRLTAHQTLYRISAYPPGSKSQLHLSPHGTDAAIGEIPVQKVGGRGADHDGQRNLSELRMVQGIDGFPAKLQPPALSDPEGFGKSYVKVVGTAREE
jgi:hypothetical protein